MLPRYHAPPGLRAAVVGARQGARLLARLLAQPAHPVEVPLDGARRHPNPNPNPPKPIPNPNQVRVAELRGHTSRVLHMAQSPDGTTIATAAADETLRFWKILGGGEQKQTKGAAVIGVKESRWGVR